MALLPLRLRIDQNMVTFLQGFFTPSDPDRGAQENASSEEGASSSSAAQEAESKSMTVTVYCQGPVASKGLVFNLVFRINT